MLQVIDTPNPSAIAGHIQTLKQDGLKAAIVYISPINMQGEKTAKAPAIGAILSAGVDVGFTCEGWGGSDNFTHRDINATCGTRDGAACGRWLQALGAPTGTAVYPAVDNDANAVHIQQLCVPYFTAFRHALPLGYKMGAYGCGALLEALDSEHLIDFRWLSNAMGWTGSRAYRDSGKWDILQGLQSKLLGIDVDPNQLNPNRTDFGFWKAE